MNSSASLMCGGEVSNGCAWGVWWVGLAECCKRIGCLCKSAWRGTQVAHGWPTHINPSPAGARAQQQRGCGANTQALQSTPPLSLTCRHQGVTAAEVWGVKGPTARNPDARAAASACAACVRGIAPMRTWHFRWTATLWRRRCATTASQTPSAQHVERAGGGRSLQPQPAHHYHLLRTHTSSHALHIVW